MARMLAVLNGGEVARRLNVTRTTVSDWSYATDPPPARVNQVRDLLLAALGQSKEAAPPEWAERLIADVAVLRAAADKDPPGKEDEPASG